MTSGNQEPPGAAGPPADQPSQPGGGPQYGPPPGSQYGPPPGSQYGPPPGSQYGPPPGSQYGPPPGSQYGPPPGSQYGPPPGQYGGYGAPYGAPASTKVPAVGVVALVLAGVGAILGIIAFTAVDWYSGTGPSKFSDVRDVVTNAQTKPYAASVAKVYFGWLAWVLLAVVVIAAVLAAIPSVSAPFRAVGVLAAVGSIVLTFIAVKFFNSKAAQISSEFRGYSTYLKHARVGFWMAVAAFLIAGIGAAIGAQRRS
jgi:hypothetical protein